MILEQLRWSLYSSNFFCLKLSSKSSRLKYCRSRSIGSTVYDLRYSGLVGSYGSNNLFIKTLPVTYKLGEET